jgi:hypothetical protein
MLKQHLKNSKRSVRRRTALAVALRNADASDFGAGSDAEGSAGDNEDNEDTDDVTSATTMTASSVMPMTSS